MRAWERIVCKGMGELHLHHCLFDYGCLVFILDTGLGRSSHKMEKFCEKWKKESNKKIKNSFLVTRPSPASFRLRKNTLKYPKRNGTLLSHSWVDTGFNTCLRGKTNQRLPTVRGIIFYCHVFSKHVTIRGIEPGIIPHSNQGSSIVVLKVFYVYYPF